MNVSFIGRNRLHSDLKFCSDINESKEKLFIHWSADEDKDKDKDIDDMSKYRARGHSQPLIDLNLSEITPFCSIHSTSDSKTKWSNIYPSLPMVNISLSQLSSRVHHLLDTHGGVLSLNSFINCYIGEFHELFNTTNQPLVSLEHLITCVPGVCITISPNNYSKRIIWMQNRDKYGQNEDEVNSEPNISTRRSISEQTFATHLSHFCKEVRELLKSQKHTTIGFNKFVPAYHSHFVRQLCVGYYGCQKLTELLEKIPHVVQIYGESDGRMITLTHREQTKRFATDLLKVLKSQIGRRIKLSEFSTAYRLIFDKDFDVCDYGVCYLEDILIGLWEGTVNISPFGSNDRWIEIPKRDRSADQMKRTAYFTKEVVELLNRSKEVIDFELTFSKFIPCYHRYFNKQCRVSDYGFTKLIELLEELSPDVIEIEFNDNYGEKHLRLNYDNRLKALIYRLEVILQKFESHSASISELEVSYNREFKSKIDYIEYYSNDLIDLINNSMNNKFRIIQTKNETKICLLDGYHFRSVAKRVVRMLMEESNTDLSRTQLETQYFDEFDQHLETNIFSDDFKDIFIYNDKSKTLRLTEMYVFARNCIICMQKNIRKKYTLDELDRELMRKYDSPLPQPTYYRCASFSELFNKIFDFFRLDKCRRSGKYSLLISLDHSFYRRPLVVKPPVYQILKRPPISDLMNSKVPETLPLPDLVPNHSLAYQTNNLINWTTDSSEDESTQINGFNSLEVNSGQTNGFSKEFSLTKIFQRKSRIVANFY